MVNVSFSMNNYEFVTPEISELGDEETKVGDEWWFDLITLSGLCFKAMDFSELTLTNSELSNIIQNQCMFQKHLKSISIKLTSKFQLSLFLDKYKVMPSKLILTINVDILGRVNICTNGDPELADYCSEALTNYVKNKRWIDYISVDDKAVYCKSILFQTS